jgi:Fur family ferric uptake transcriptional regulator
MNSESILNQYSIQKSRPRLQIIEVILSLGEGHFSVEDILKALRRKRSRVSRASSYRAIKLLSKKGFLRTTDLGKRFQVYEVASNKKHHDHLYCVRCGRIIEFEVRLIEKLQLDICQEKRFKPLSHTLRISGLCKECRPC